VEYSVRGLSKDWVVDTSFKAKSGFERIELSRQRRLYLSCHFVWTGKGPAVPEGDVFSLMVASLRSSPSADGVHGVANAGGEVLFYPVGVGVYKLFGTRAEVAAVYSKDGSPLPKGEFEVLEDDQVFLYDSKPPRDE
jgi:hypothetical protein